MTQPKLAPRSVASIAADAAYKELSHADLEYPSVVDKNIDIILDFNLETPELQKKNVLVIDFLDVDNALG